MDNDNRSLLHWDGGDSRRSDPSEERRENKRLKYATCVERIVYDGLGKDRSKQNEQQAMEGRASKVDLAQDWRKR
jgi:hypothetical protein